jgi:hypothetical protein
MAAKDIPGLPVPSTALEQAQALLDEDKDNRLFVDPASLVPNPLQGLWIVSFASPAGESLDGGGIYVDADGAHYLSSDPGASELIGALFEDEDEDPGDAAEIDALIEQTGVGEDEFDALIEQFTVNPEIDALLDHFGFDPSQPRAEDGRWDPSGGGGKGRDDNKQGPTPPKAAEDKKVPTWKQEVNLVKAILATLKDVLSQLSSKQAKALIDQIENNAKAFIKGQQDSHSGPAGGGGSGSDKGGKDSGGADTGGKSKGGKDTGDSGGGSDDSGGGGGKPGGLEGVIAGVKGLIEGYGRNMKDDDRKMLEQAVSKLG